MTPPTRVAKVVEAEEKQFDRVLKIGLTRLNEELQGSFTGEKAFHLYETFGLPLDFMVDAARDAGVKFDEAGFELPVPKSKLAPAPVGKAGARNPPARLSAICRRPFRRLPSAQLGQLRSAGHREGRRGRSRRRGG